jgi:type II secretory pathway component GspD/PulD (secretin)
MTGLMMTGLMLLVATRAGWAQPREEWSDGLTAKTAEATSLTGKSAAGPTPPQLALSQEERLKTVVDLSFTSANLKNVLNSLAKIYELNIVAGEEVEGVVTLTLRQVSLQEGLRQILRLNGFGFTVRAGIIEVVKLQEQRVAELLHVRFVDLDTALEFVQPLASEDAVLEASETANAILVSDKLDKIQEMRALLAEVDQPPQQVLIESKLMDLTHSDLDAFGYNLSSIGATVPLRVSDSTISNKLVVSSGAFELNETSTDLSGDEFAFTLTRADDALTATIDALIRDNKAKVIASPTILTLNNVEAKITIGEKYPIREQTQTTTGTLETTRFVDVGTTLRVTPRINRDGYIQLHIHPEVSSVNDTLDAGPRITTREADTTVLLRDGQPIVMGGLIQEDETFITERVPLLGHVPFLGLLFQTRSKDYEQKELVIVLTPHIIDVAGQARSSAAIQEAADRMETSELLSQGQALEEQLTITARRMPRLMRYAQALEVYERVVARHPRHPYAEEALWRIGRVAREELRDLARAERAYQQLITQFPDGVYRRRAERRLKAVRRELAWRGAATAP